MYCRSELFSILGKVTIGVLAERFINPSYHRLTQCIWNDFDRFRTGPRTTPVTDPGGGAGGARPLFWTG